MHLGIRLLFGFFLITGLAGFFVLRIFMVEVKPSVREVMEDMMVDTANIHLAMNVQDAMDPHGLPMELPLTVGQRIEVEGEYIPKATAGASNKKGAAAVIHFTHNPCGYAVIAGQTYR